MDSGNRAPCLVRGARKHDRRRGGKADVRWTVTAASLGFALVQLDVTTLNVALPNIARAPAPGSWAS
jgi:hypothetical protein